METLLYKEVVRERLCEQIAMNIQKLIIKGKLLPGDKLPPEKELAKKFGVSRTAVREAIKALIQKGLIKVEVGKGTFIDKSVLNSLKESLGLLIQLEKSSLLDLLEVRQTLEVKIAELAAERVKEHNLKEIERIIQRMDENLDSAEKYIEADMDFHTAIAKATQNQLFLFLINSIVDLLQESRKFIFDIAGSPQRAQRYHKEIYKCIKERESYKAKIAMQKHLTQVYEDIQAAQTKGHI